MDKSTKISGVIIAICLTFIALVLWEPSRDVILNGLQQGVFNPIYWIGVGINDWLSTFPGGIVAVGGIGGGLFLAVVLQMLVRPRLPFTHGTPQTTSSTIHRTSTTPPNATTRPELPVQKVEIEVKTNPQPKAETVKEEPATA